MESSDSSNCRSDLGRATEDRALEYLLQQGAYRLITRNYRQKFGELDLVLEQRLGVAWELVIVEVRLRGSRGWVTGSESVGPKKRRRLEKTAAHFLREYRGPAVSLRFDVLAWNGEIWEHLRRAW